MSYEVKAYVELSHGYWQDVPRRYAYRYCDGRVWLTVGEIAERLQFEDDEIQEALNQVLPRLSSQENHVHEFKSEIITNNPDNRIKCYDWKVLQCVMQQLNAKNKQFLLWVKSESGADSKHAYERLLKREAKHRQGLTEGYRFTWFDRLWYEYELAGSNYRHLWWGGELPFIYVIVAILFILYALGVPWYIALILYFFLVYCLSLFFNEKRQAAIKVHYNHIDKPKDIIMLTTIPWLIMMIGILIGAYFLSQK